MSRALYPYLRDTQGLWQPWNGDPSTLGGPAAPLAATQTRSLHDGTLPGLPRYFQLYTGYRLDGEVIFGSRPLTLGVAP